MDKIVEDVVTYIRKSIRDEKQSTATQRAKNSEESTRRGFNIVKEYIDDGVSGTKASRPALDEMLRDMRDGKFKTIIVYKLDRLGRSLSNLLNLMQEFRNRGIRLVSIKDGIDTAVDTAMTRAFWQMQGVFAELEREMIADRVGDAMARIDNAIKKDGSYKAKSGRVITKRGRPEGKKDVKKERAISGYHTYWASPAGKARREIQKQRMLKRHKEEKDAKDATR